MSHLHRGNTVALEKPTLEALPKTHCLPLVKREKQGSPAPVTPQSEGSITT